MNSRAGVEARATVPRQGPFAPLRNADFRHLVTSNALWWLALFMENLVIGWLVLEMTNSPQAVAMVGFARSLPFLLLGFVGGTVIDRFGRRRVIVGAQAATTAIYGLLLLLVVVDRLALWQLVAACFGLGTAWALDWPARRALMPDLVGKQQTVDAMLLENFAQGSARISGPSLAGALVAWSGPVGCLAVMLGLALVTLRMLMRLSTQPVPRLTMVVRTTPLLSLGGSLRYVASNQPILGVVLVTFILNLLLVPYIPMLPVFARDVLGQGPGGLGLLGAAAGVGAFAGLLLANYARRYVSNGWIFWLGTVGMGLSVLVFSQSTQYGLSWAMVFGAGLGQACFSMMQSSIILLSASDEMRSQTMGVLVLAIGADPLGKLLTGVLAEATDAPTAVGIQATLGLVALAAVGLFLPGLRARPDPAPLRTGAN